MSLLFQFPRTRQPPGIPQAESNSLTRGLLALASGNSGPFVFNSGTTEYNSLGQVAAFSSTQYAQVPYSRATVTNECTWFCFFDRLNSGGNGFLWGDVEAAGTGYNAGVYCNGSNYLFFVKTGGGGSSVVVGATSYTVTNDPISVCGTYGAGGLKVYLNGKLDGTNSSVSGTLDATSFGAYLNRWNNTSGGWAPRHIMSAAWRRELQAMEVLEIHRNPWRLFKSPSRKYWAPSASSGNIYTITPSGGIAFSGGTTLLRTHVQSVSGGIAFSGSASLRRTHVQPVSGGIVFSGAVPLLRTRAQIPSGSVVFSGTAPITFVPAAGGTTYTITPSGGISFSGTSPFARTHVQTVSGGLSFSGAAPLLRTRTMVPVGSITFGGTVPLIRTRVQVPSGQIVFSGSAGIVFIPAGSVTAVALNRISMGLDRAHRLS